MKVLEIAGEDVLVVPMPSLEARAVVLTRVRMGSVSHRDADEMLELLRSTPRRDGARKSLLGHAAGVLARWYETIGMFLPRTGSNPGASRVMPDRVKVLGWSADVGHMIRAADGRQCVGGSGSAVMDSIEARCELDYLRNSGAHDMDVEQAERRARNTRRRLGCKIGLAWLACLPRMQRL